ncbi:MAG TPA: hypothetical protein VK718_03025 [Ferruginibacter sp.]|jgi:hypothetical protein|nr:hypothetical protein [Ferruginibacter sp.]
MQKKLRQQFNTNFSKEKYQAYIDQIENICPGALDFRLAETPVFVPKEFTQKMLAAAEDIIDVITDNRFKKITEMAIPANLVVANENNHAHFLALDFGVCENESGEVEPQLVEMQGFPSLFAFQVNLNDIAQVYASIPETHSSYLNGYTKETTLQLLKEIIVGDTDPKNVILLDIFPDQQKTRLDFYCTEKALGIKAVCITKLIAIGNKLFYEKDGERVEIKKIFNRLVFDDLHLLKDTAPVIDITYPWDVEWVSHPNWFYRISKYTLPFIRNQYVPQTYFLHEIKELPGDLENYVLKPLFSYAGMGVMIDVTKEDIDKITDPENWILQRKVKYAAIIETPDRNAKVEIRLFYFWKDGWDRPIAVHNLTRLSKGKMIGTRYNENETWVGGSISFFEK